MFLLKKAKADSNIRGIYLGLAVLGGFLIEGTVWFFLDPLPDMHTGIGALIATCLIAFISIFLQGLFLSLDFDRSVAFGCSRKRFFWSSLVIALADLILGLCVCVVSSLMSTALYAARSGYSFSALLFHNVLLQVLRMAGIRTVWVILAICALCLLVGSLTHRFGIKAMWGMSFAIILINLGRGWLVRLAARLHFEQAFGILTESGAWILLLTLSILLGVISWLIFKKEPVKSF